MIKDERETIPSSELVVKDQRDYIVRYTDAENETINVSDDEDLQTCYEVAETELNGNIKFVIDFRRKPVE